MCLRAGQPPSFHCSAALSPSFRRRYSTPIDVQTPRVKDGTELQRAPRRRCPVGRGRRLVVGLLRYRRGRAFAGRWIGAIGFGPGVYRAGGGFNPSMNKHAAVAQILPHERPPTSSSAKSYFVNSLGRHNGSFLATLGPFCIKHLKELPHSSHNALYTARWQDREAPVFGACSIAFLKPLSLHLVVRVRSERRWRHARKVGATFGP